jgi:signal transduction histidine kinase
MISLRVSDNGQGFTPEARSHGLGLRGIAERVHMLHGVYDLKSAPGEGTRIVVDLPLR